MQSTARRLGIACMLADAELQRIHNHYRVLNGSFPPGCRSVDWKTIYIRSLLNVMSQFSRGAKEDSITSTQHRHNAVSNYIRRSSNSGNTVDYQSSARISRMWCKKTSSLASTYTLTELSLTAPWRVLPSPNVPLPIQHVSVRTKS